ncbi:acyl-CoA dehydrogenase [Cohnella terricola]|uniref:Acyl-CoA dehydrogenase n=1 Tax=Cohnella terricola TaxID=1289167 RepID=A0A559JN89_9BACL|nr:acyl-CoA dehydrogenase [Cohnella terricola]TVY01355.1 acyl-CoA dehydrogenase [Cohnella terricola]
MSISIPETIKQQVRDNASINDGRLTPELLAYIYETKLFKLFVPEELNGLGMPLPEALRVFEQASGIDGSFGWLVTIGSGGGFFSATLPPSQAKELFGVANAVVAGSGQVSGTARRTEGGYVVNGRWKYCSGSTFASLFTANCRIEGGEPGAGEEIRSFAFLPEQVSVIHDWNAFGLKGTDSHTIEVKDAFVPADRTFSIMSEPNYNDPIFRYPFMPFAQTSFAAVSLGICRHFIEEAQAFAESKRREWETTRPGRTDILQRVIGEQARLLEADAEIFYGTVERTWETFKGKGEMGEAEQADVQNVCRTLARNTLVYTNMIFLLLGMTALMEDHPLNRTWRDLHTVTQHSALVPWPEQ